MSMFLTNSGLIGDWVPATASAKAGSGAPFDLSDYEYVKFRLTGSSWHGHEEGSNVYYTSIISPSSIEVTVPATGSGTFSASGWFGQCHTSKYGPDDQGNYAWHAASQPASTNIANRGTSATCRGTAVYKYEWSGDNHDILVISVPGPYDLGPSAPYKTFSDNGLYESGRMYFRSAGAEPGWVITTSYSHYGPTWPSATHPQVWSAFGDSVSSYTAYSDHGAFKPLSSEP